MTKKMMLMAVVGCFTVAAVTSSHAAATPASGATILQNVNVALTVYTQGATTPNHPGTVDTSKVTVSKITTKSLIGALVPGSTPKAKLLQYSTYGGSTNFVGYGYSVTTILYSNSIAVDTNSVVATNGVTNTSFSITLDYTDTNATGLTNPVVVIPATNSFVSNYVYLTNLSSTYLASNTVTPNGGISPSGLVLLSSGFEVLDTTGVTYLTNTTVYPFLPTASNTFIGTNMTNFATFSLTPFTSATNEFNGTDKLMTDAASGKAYSFSALRVNTGGTMNLVVYGLNTGSVGAANVGGTSKANPPVELNYTNVNMAVAGYGFMNGTDVAATNSTSTNYSYSAATPVLIKGTVTGGLYKVEKTFSAQ